MERKDSCFPGLLSLGITYDDADSLRLLSMRLRRWAERECNGEISRRDDGKVETYNTYSGECVGLARDMETPAIARVSAIVAKYPGLAWFHQTDPRGAAVYVYRVADLAGRDIDACYSGVGKAAY